MDILVTTPKSEMANSALEGEQVRSDLSQGMDAYWFRVYHFKPKVEKGDKIFFTENGLIKGYGVIFAIEEVYDKEETECDTTGRFWGNQGDWMVKYRDWHWLNKPIRFKGFQGIRYLQNLPEIYNEVKSAIPPEDKSSGILAPIL